MIKYYFFMLHFAVTVNFHFNITLNTFNGTSMINTLFHFLFHPILISVMEEGNYLRKARINFLKIRAVKKRLFQSSIQEYEVYSYVLVCSCPIYMYIFIYVLHYVYIFVNYLQFIYKLTERNCESLML